ncbi:recombinase family protein [Kitasatospora sp. NPDC054768]
MSTDAQEEQGHRRAHREGYAVRKVWKDIASGFKDVERADFDRALKALAGGVVPALWAYAVDRFSRKGAEDLLKVIGKVRVIFDMDGLDSNEPRDRRWIINRAEEAREYSETLSRRVRDTKEEQRDGGLWVAGRAPWATRFRGTASSARIRHRRPKECRRARTNSPGRRRGNSLRLPSQ